MPEETLIVADCDDGHVRVRVRQHRQCSRCPANRGCGHSLLGKLHAGREESLTVPLPGTLRGRVAAGDRLTLRISRRSLIGMSLLLYLVPLSVMLTAVTVAEILRRVAVAGELPVVLAAVAGLAAGVTAVRKLAVKCAMPIRVIPLTDRSAAPGHQSRVLECQ